MRLAYYNFQTAQQISKSLQSNRICMNSSMRILLYYMTWISQNQICHHPLTKSPLIITKIILIKPNYPIGIQFATINYQLDTKILLIYLYIKTTITPLNFLLPSYNIRRLMAYLKKVPLKLL